MLLAQVPPLWFKVMHKKLAILTKNNCYKHDQKIVPLHFQHKNNI